MSASATTTSYKSFAIAGGSSVLGSLITSELLSQGASVVILGRSDSQSVPEGAELRVIDYQQEDTLLNALKGVEVVISVLSKGGFAVQPTLATAAKKAGVKLFVPSEFGTPSDRFPKDSPLSFKLKVHEHLRSINLPFALFYNGVFTDYAFSPAFGFDIPNGKLTIVGDGTTPVSFTARPDVAYFVAHALTHLPPSSLNNAILQAEGEKATFVQVAQAMEEVFGKPFEVVNTPVALAEEQSKAGGPQSFVAWIGLGMQRGYADVGVAENQLVPGFKPLTVRESLRKYYV